MASKNVKAFSKESADIFVTKMLHLPHPDSLFQKDKLGLLSQIVETFQAAIPFQSLSLMAKPLSKRRVPTMEENISEVEAGRGGLCYTLNTFMKILLEALGYTVHHVLSTVKYPDNHILSMVYDVLFPGDKYLVEVGVGYPTFRPIPINFDKESPVYEDSFVKYKYAWKDGLLVRYQTLCGCKHGGHAAWQYVYSVDVTPRELSTFESPMATVYTNPDSCPFHTSLRAIIFRNQTAVCIRDMSLLIEDDSHDLKETNFSCDQEFLDAVNKYFPLQDYSRQALCNYHAQNMICQANDD